MANQFGSYSPVVPSNTSWQEQITFLQDDDVTPVDLTGLKLHSQIRPATPAAASGVPTIAPTLELTTSGFYDVAPGWPVYEGWSIPVPTNGTIFLDVPRDTYLPLLNPTNTKVKYVWDVVVVAADGTIQPIVSGKVICLPGTTF